MIDRFQAFVAGITTCYRHIQKIKSMEMTELGLKGTHVMCIFFLHLNPEGLTATQLCRLCAEDKAAISRTIATLQGKGYIISGEKKYRAIIRLTDEGREIAAKVEGLIGQWVNFGGLGLDEDERNTFYRVLEKIAGNLERGIGKDTREDLK